MSQRERQPQKRSPESMDITGTTRCRHVHRHAQPGEPQYPAKPRFNAGTCMTDTGSGYENQAWYKNIATLANNNANAIERDHSLGVYQKISMRESKTEQAPST